MHEYRNILLLGGTTEAYHLADMLEKQDTTFITSLAGRTQNPRIPKGHYRIGGFGGIDGLINYIQEENIDLVIDATHPFAEKITEHACQATKTANIELLRLERPLWQQKSDDKWINVHTLSEACESIPSKTHCFLGLGRQYLSNFLNRNDVHFTARMLELPDNIQLYAAWQILLENPGDKEHEKKLLKEHKIDVIVCRNSGGTASYAKIEAARDMQLPVIMISRKQCHKMTCVPSVEAAIEWLKYHSHDKAMN